MTLENAIELYEESKEFQEFCIVLKTKNLDDAFKKEKNFSLTEKGGFLRLLKRSEKKF